MWWHPASLRTLRHRAPSLCQQLFRTMPYPGAQHASTHILTQTHTCTPHTYTYTHIHVHTRTHTHTHIHTHTHTLPEPLQDALFQLDPEPAAAASSSDASAAAGSRPDLVELINRLREHHGNSLLGPALHVLRTLGNTAVHLDRDRWAGELRGWAAGSWGTVGLVVVLASPKYCKLVGAGDTGHVWREA